MKILTAKQQDLVEIVDLNKLFHLDINGFKWDTPRWIRKEIDAGNYIVIKDSSRVLGALCLNLDYEDAYIETIAVRKDMHGLGLGKKLVDFAKTKSFEVDKSVLRVESFCEYHLVGFYQRCGFRKVRGFGDYAGHPYHIFLMKL